MSAAGRVIFDCNALQKLVNYHRRETTVIVFHFILPVAVSLLTAWTALQLYLNMPSGWLCEAGETPLPEHLAENRCPHRKTAFILMTSATALVFSISGNFCRSVPDYGDLLFLSVVSTALFPAVLSDLDYRIIPDQSCLAVFLAAVLKELFSSGLPGLGTTVGGGFLCGFMMLLPTLISFLLSGKESIGMGDVKLLTACGAAAASASADGFWLMAACSVYILCVFSSALWFSLLLLCRRAQYGEARPLGPWIALATLLTIALCLKTV